MIVQSLVPQDLGNFSYILVQMLLGLTWGMNVCKFGPGIIMTVLTSLIIRVVEHPIIYN